MQKKFKKYWKKRKKKDMGATHRTNSPLIIFEKKGQQAAHSDTPSKESILL